MAKQSEGKKNKADKVKYFDDNGNIIPIKSLRDQRVADSAEGLYEHDGSKFHGRRLKAGWYTSNLAGLKPLTKQQLDELTKPADATSAEGTENLGGGDDAAVDEDTVQLSDNEKTQARAAARELTDATA